MSARPSWLRHLEWLSSATVVLGIPYAVVFVFGYESWVGRFIASAYVLTGTLFIICIFVVFAPSERLISPEGKLRRLKSDTPRRVVEIVARTLGVGLAIFFVVYLINMVWIHARSCLGRGRRRFLES